MGAALKTRIVQIGNSRGVRLPKRIIERAGLENEVEIEVADGQIIIRPTHAPRAGWDEQFRAMAERGDDYLLDAEASSLTEWDGEEWEW
jgi:antitoxin MazE